MGRALAHRVEEGVEDARQPLLHLHVSHRAGAVAHLQRLHGGPIRVEVIEVGEDRVAFDRARDVGADAVRVGVHAVHLLLHRLGVVREQDGVAERLAHLALAVGAGQRVSLHQVVGDREDLAVEVVEAAGDLAGDLDVRLVVLADRHQVGARQQDVGGLEHRVAQQPQRDRLLIQQRGAGHVFDAWQAGQPRHRHQVAEEQRQLVGLVHGRLEEDGGLGRVNARAEVVQHHAAGVIRGRVDVFPAVLGGQHVQVGDDEVALVFVLQAHAVAQAAHVMPQVQPAGGTVAGEDAFSVAHRCSPEWGDGNRETSR